MDKFLGVLIVAGAIFGICFLIDRLFARLFRNAEQYRSGLSVKLNKRYGSIGLLMCVLGLAAVFTGLAESWILVAGGAFLAVIGTALIIYYISFSDDDSAVLISENKQRIPGIYGENVARFLGNYNLTFFPDLDSTENVFSFRHTEKMLTFGRHISHPFIQFLLFQLIILERCRFFYKE